MIFVSQEMQARLDAAALVLGRETEEIPTLAMTFLEWFIEQRQSGYELMLGRRENPDDHEEIHLYSVPSLKVVLMDENGVESQGVLDVVAPGSDWQRDSD